MKKKKRGGRHGYREYEEGRKSEARLAAGAQDGQASRRQALRQKQIEANEEDAEFEEWMKQRQKSHTVAEISQGTGLKHEDVRQAMKAAEDNFVHWPHPEPPDMTRYTLRAHVEEAGLQGWNPERAFETTNTGHTDDGIVGLADRHRSGCNDHCYSLRDYARRFGRCSALGASKIS